MPDPVLHGRDVQLAALRDALAATLGGRGGLVLVSGEAGIGKSALVAQLAREASAATVTWGRAWEFADAPPYFPVLPCLRALRLAPLGDPFELWEQVLHALARAPAPTVWILEDLHAADLATLDLLAFLAQPLRAMRVLVVATARLADPRVTERMLQRFARIARDGTELRLEPLAAADIAALAGDTLGTPPPAPALAKLVELTGGNPLFVVECARAFRAGGSAVASLPPTVRQVVLDRVALLPESTRAALAAGAVLGRELAAATVARMSDALPARVIDDLLPALRAGIVRETKPGQFMFSHMIVRDAIEDAIDAATCVELHRRADAALAMLAETSEVVVERARHALAALGAHDPAPTLALLARATELLEHERAYDRAHELHERIAAARASGLLPPADGATQLHAARIARAAGRGDVSRRLCDAIVTRARAAGDPELLARAALLAFADVRPGVIDRAQVELLEEARTALGDRAPALGCRVLARLATAIQPAPDPSVPMAMAREARARAEALGDTAAVVDVLELAGWGIYNTAPAERIAWAGELRDRALDAAQLDKAITAYTWLFAAHAESADFAAFERDIAALSAAADELGHPRYRWRALLAASGAEAAAGRATESERHVTEVEQLAPMIDDPALPLALALHRLMIAVALRRDDEVRARIAALTTDLRHVTNAELMGAMMGGWCAARIGDVELARSRLAFVASLVPIATMFETSGPWDPQPFVCAELVACAGDATQRRALKAIIARGPALGMTGGAFWFTYDGPTARIRARLAASLGDHAEAEAHWRDALALARAHRHRPWIAQIAHELAAHLRAIGRANDAAELADEAHRIAREVGMPGLAGAPVIADIGPLLCERAGAEWRLARGPTSVTVKDSRGMQLLARLVERPGEELHVLALASDDAAINAPESSAGELLDERARKAYRRRLAELDDRLADAESRGDAAAAIRIERERDALVAELARATGLGGKARAAASTSERARVNVQKRLKDAIGRIAELDADLGDFLDHAVRTGTYCCFRP